MKIVSRKFSTKFNFFTKCYTYFRHLFAKPKLILTNLSNYFAATLGYRGEGVKYLTFSFGNNEVLSTLPLPPFQAEISWWARQQAWANIYVQQLFQHVYFKNISLFIMGWREAKFSYKIISCSCVGIITLKSNGQVTLRCSLFVRKKCLCQERFVIVKNWWTV